MLSAIRRNPQALAPCFVACPAFAKDQRRRNERRGAVAGMREATSRKALHV